MMNYRRYVSRNILIGVVLLVLLFITMVYALSHGGYDLSFGEVLSALFGRSGRKTHVLIWNIRFPRVLAGIFTGASLAVSGAVVQGALRNPLASPFTMGVSHGAMFGASLAIILGAGYSESTGRIVLSNPYVIILFAFAGAMIPSIVIFILGKTKKAAPETVVLMGIAMSSLFTAATTLVQYFADELQLATMVYWSFGDLGRATWKGNVLLLTVSIAIFVYFFLKAWDINAMVAGDEVAKSSGVRVEKIRLVMVLLSSLMTAVGVALVGVIGFVGLVSPHMIRIFIGEDYRFLVPFSALLGGLILLLADTFARLLFSPMVLPVGVVTSFLGAPLFIYLLVRSDRMK
nr:putative iron(III) ABC transporter, permease protein [Thermotoga sp. RQ7]